MTGPWLRLRPAARLAAVLALALIALAPVLLLGAHSVFVKEGVRFEPGFQLDSFGEAFSGEGNLSLLVKTLTTALLAAGIATTVAFALVYCATILLPRWHRPVLVIALLALFGGFLVRIFAWRTLLGEQGIVASLDGGTGALDFIAEAANTRWAVLLALTNFSIPLCVLPIASSFAGVDRGLLAASRDLGASPGTTFRRVILPLTLRGATFAFALSFVLCAGDYVTPALLGGRDGFMFGSLIAQKFSFDLNWSLGASLAIVLMISVALVVAAAFALSGYAARRLSGATRPAPSRPVAAERTVPA